MKFFVVYVTENYDLYVEECDSLEAARAFVEKSDDKAVIVHIVDFADGSRLEYEDHT